MFTYSVMFEVQDMEDLFQSSIYSCHLPLKCIHPGWSTYACVTPFSLLLGLWCKTVPEYSELASYALLALTLGYYSYGI